MTDRQLKSFTTSRMISGLRSGTRIFLLISLLIAFGLFRYVFPERPIDYTGLRALSDSFFALGLLAIILLLSGGIGLKIIKWLRVIPYMLYVGLRFGSDTFAKLLHMSYAILLMMATFTFGRRFLGKEGGWIAAAVLIAIPIFPMWASWAYADMAWAMYEFLGIYALILWIESCRREWLVLSALAMGLALGSKYLALGSAAMLGLMVIWASRKQGWKLMIQNAAIFGDIALLIGSPWYLKNWLWTGNPDYPLYFGGLQWPAERVQLLMAYLNGFGTGHRISDYLVLPWNVYAHNELFSTFLGSIETPSFLFPLLIFFPLVPHNKIIRLLGLVILMRLAIWAVGSQQIRFLLPVFPGLSRLTESILIGAEKKFSQFRNGRVIKAGLIDGVVVATLVYSFIFFFLVKPLGVFWGSESKLHFISRRVADIAATSYIEEKLASSD